MGEKSGRGTSLQLLRRGLLVVLLTFVTVVVALYLIGRTGRPTESGRPPDLEEDRQGRLVLSGKGFDYGLTQGDREVFRIRASRILSDRENNYELEGVELTMKRDDGREYRLISDRANYNIDTQEATFEGAVRFFGPREVELSADGLELREEGELLVSSSPVEFRFLGRYAGNADRLRINPDRELFVLAGRVEVHTLAGEDNPMSLSCRRFTFEREAHQLRAEGQVVLSRGGDWLKARRLSVILTDDDRKVEFVQARWNVRGELQQATSDGQTSTVELEGWEVSVLFDPASEQPRTAELQGRRGQLGRLAITDQSALRRQIDAAYVVGNFEAGSLVRARAVEEVEIRELIAFEPTTVLRTACADTAVANLSPTGELSEVHLEGSVSLQDHDTQGFADAADADMAAGRMKLAGDPAWLLRGDAQLQAPRIVYHQTEGRILAEPNVRAMLAGSESISLRIGSESRRQPIRIEAQRAEWSGDPAAVWFRGKVRAWQGENFLVSEELKGEPDGSRVTAAGGVKTVWRSRTEAAGDVDGLDSSEPLEVSADEMVYERQNRRLVYTGNARAVQLERTLRCQEMVLFFADNDAVDEMNCEGGTQLIDGASGNTVVGERAVYRPAERTVQVEGTPVTMRDRRGTEIKGKVLVYDIDTATARIKSEPPAPAQPLDGR